MGQMHDDAEFSPGVRGPVPAIGGFQHHLRGLPGRAITSRRYSQSLEIRTVSRRCPVSVIRTNTDRRRCRSIPTMCRPSYAPLTGPPKSLTRAPRA